VSPPPIRKSPPPPPPTKRNTAMIRILCYVLVAGGVLIGWRVYTAPKSPSPTDKRTREFLEQDAVHRANEQRALDQQVIGG